MNGGMLDFVEVSDTPLPYTLSCRMRRATATSTVECGEAEATHAASKWRGAAVSKPEQGTTVLVSQLVMSSPPGLLRAHKHVYGMRLLVPLCHIARTFAPHQPPPRV